jgi:hypothetical protein
MRRMPLGKILAAAAAVIRRDLNEDEVRDDEIHDWIKGLNGNQLVALKRVVESIRKCRPVQ